MPIANQRRFEGTKQFPQPSSVVNSTRSCLDCYGESLENVFSAEADIPEEFHHFKELTFRSLSWRRAILMILSLSLTIRLILFFYYYNSLVFYTESSILKTILWICIFIKRLDYWFFLYSHISNNRKKGRDQLQEKL